MDSIMAMNWSDTPYEDAVREQATSQTDYRALAAQLAHVAMQAKTEMNRLGNILNWSADIPKSYAAAMNAISNQFETGAVDAARKAGIL